MDGVTSCGIDCISALGRARLDGHGRDCVVSSPLLPAVGWSSFSRLRPAGSRSLDACAATCRLPVGLSSCAFWCCSKASFCAFFWSLCFAGSLYFGLVLRWGLVLWPGTLAEGGILEGYFDAADAKERPIVRIAYRDCFLAAAAAALVAGAAVVALVAPRLLLCAFAVNRSLQVTPVDAPIGTLAHRAPQRRRAVARWTANGAVTGGDPPLVPFDENQACPSSTPSRKRMTVITNIYGRNQLVTNMSGRSHFASSRIVTLWPSVTEIVFLTARNRNIW